MGSDSPSKTSDHQARDLAEALSALEARLDAVERGDDPDLVADALAEPVRAFSSAAKEALR